MADFGTFDLSNVLTSVDQIRSAQLQRQLYGNQLAEVERKRQEEQDLRAARTAAWGGDKEGVAQLAGLDPQAAVSIQNYYDGLSKEKKATELEAAQKATERLAKSAAWVKGAATPEEAAGRWAIIRKSDPAIGKQMPEQYDPAMVDLAISQAQSLGDVLAGLDKEKGQKAFSGAMGALGSSFFDQMGQKESGGDYGAQNPNSSASGKYQFIDSTWKSVMGDAPRTPENQEIAMRKLTDQNAQALSRAGFNPSPQVLALAHQQGVGGAIQLMSNPEKPAVSIVGADAVRLNGGNESMTAGEFAQRVMGYYSGGDGAQQQPQGQQTQTGPQMDPRYLMLMQAAGMMPEGDPRLDVLKKVAESFAPQQQKAPEPFTLAEGQARFDAQGNQIAAVAPQADQPDPFTLSPGQSRFDGQGKQIASAAPNVEGFTLSEGQTRYGPDGQPLTTAPKQADPASTGKMEADLRKEFSGLPPVKNFTVQANAMSQLAASAKDPSAAGDLSLIYSYMKMLDPNSVVRETEFATAQNAAGVPDQIRNVWNRALSGERLNPDQRNDFISRAKSIYDGAKQQYDALAQQYQGLASGQGGNPENVIPQFGFQGQMPDAGGTGGPAQIQTVDQYNQLPSGAQYTDPNGQVRTKR